MTRTLHPSRLITSLVILGICPLLFIFWNFQLKKTDLMEVENLLDTIEKNIFIKEKKQFLNKTVRQHYRDADHFYLDKYIESLPLLEKETEALQKNASHPNYIPDEATKKRLEFLINSNHLSFSEGKVQSNPYFQETLETLLQPVEINIEDLKKILTKIEGVSIGDFQVSPQRPQLLITDFKIEKKRNLDKNEVFILNMKLLKREYL